MFKKLILFCLSGCLTTTAYPADISSKIYQIECIILMQPNASTLLASSSKRPDLAPEAHDLAAGSTINLGHWSGLQRGRVPLLVRLPKAYWQLADIDRKLGASAVLYHFAWRQQLSKDPQVIQLKFGFPPPKTNMTTIDQLQLTDASKANTDFPFSGQLTLTKSLYIKTELALDFFNAPTPSRVAISHIEASRSIKVGKLTYIDHPVFGVLILISTL